MKFLLITLLAAAASASFAPLYTAKERIDGSYIVVLNDGESLTAALNTLRSSPFFSPFGGRIDRIYGSVLNGFAATLGEKALEYIRSMDIVKYVEEDGIVRTSAASWGLDRIDQRSLPLDNSYTPTSFGTNVHVYVIDSGIRTSHNDFGGRVMDGISYVDDGRGANDCNGHGTHCAGTIGGNTYGVAKDVFLHSVRVFGCTGGSAWSTIISAMNWVGDNHVSPAVASMSLGGGYSNVVNNAVSNLSQKGVTVVVSAGNDNQDACNASPASSPDAITVGATDKTDTRASFSNYGSCVDIFAPGVDIVSSWWWNDDDHNTISGTSMACPHVAGAAALLLGEGSSDVRNALISNATPDVVGDAQLGSPNRLLYV